MPSSRFLNRHFYESLTIDVWFAELCVIFNNFCVELTYVLLCDTLSVKWDTVCNLKRTPMVKRTLDVWTPCWRHQLAWQSSSCRDSRRSPALRRWTPSRRVHARRRHPPGTPTRPPEGTGSASASRRCWPTHGRGGRRRPSRTRSRRPRRTRRTRISTWSPARRTKAVLWTWKCLGTVRVRGRRPALWDRSYSSTRRRWRGWCCPWLPSDRHRSALWRRQQRLTQQGFSNRTPRDGESTDTTPDRPSSQTSAAAFRDHQVNNTFISCWFRWKQIQIGVVW